MQTWRLPILLYVLPILASSSGGCPDSPTSDVGLDSATLTDAPLTDRTTPADLPPVDVPRCPSLDLGDAASAMGWKVAQSAGVDLHALACVKGHVYIAGDKGTLLHRSPKTPYCNSFSKQKVPTVADLYTVSFADLSYGVTAGKDPRIWQTTDEGKVWSEALQCGAVMFSAFHSLHLYAAAQGYGVGVDGKTGNAAYKVYPGKTWICPDQTFANQTFHDSFRRQMGGWMVGDTNGIIYHTPDESSTWFFIDTKISKPLRGVSITNAMVGIAVGDEGTILRSEDGKGLDWSLVKTLGNDDLWEVFFLDDKLGWAVGEGGTILHTNDSGKTWSYQSVPILERLEDVCFVSASEGWVVSAKGTILYTTTGGQ